MHTLWIMVGIILIAVLVPIFFAIAIVLGLKDAGLRQEELKRYPSLRSWERYKNVCVLIALVGGLPAVWLSMDQSCPLGIRLAGSLIQVVSITVYLSLYIIQNRERERLRQQPTEAAGDQ